VSLPIEEEWRPIPGYEGRYAVSNDGRLMSFLACPAGREMRAVLQNGYRSVGLRAADGTKKIHRVHRLVLMAFDRLPVDGEVARHLNDVKSDNRIENLAWGSYSDNTQDCIRNGGNYWLSKNQCHSGHDLTPDNVQISRKGERTIRSCRKCIRKRLDRYNAMGRSRSTCPECSREMRSDHVARHRSLVHPPKEIAG